MAKPNEVLIYIKDKVSLTGLGKVGATIDGIGVRLKKVFQGIGVAAVGVLTASIWQLTKAVKEFAGQELGETDLLSSLKQMGVYTEEYQAKLVKLASHYQDLTNIGDEVWLKTFGQLTRFGAHAGNIDKVAEATKNLAALMDGNLQGAALAMQRAIEGEFSMFSRYGIKLDLTGDKVADLDMLMTKLADKGGGLLEARTQTLSGKTVGLKNAITDFREEIGRTMSNSLGLKDVLDTLTGKFKELQVSAKNGKIHEIVDGAATRVRAFSDTLGEIVEQINSMGDLKDLAEGIGQYLLGHAQNAAGAAVKILSAAMPLMGRKLGEAIRDGGLGKDSASSIAKQRRDDKIKAAAANQTTAGLGFEYDPSKGRGFTGKNAQWDSEFQNRKKALSKSEGQRLYEKYLKEEYAKEGADFSEQFGSGWGADNLAEADAIFKNLKAGSSPAVNNRGFAEVNGQRVALPGKGYAEVNGRRVDLGSPISAASGDGDLVSKTNDQSERLLAASKQVGKSTEAMVSSTEQHMQKITTATETVQDRTVRADDNLSLLIDNQATSFQNQEVMAARIISMDRQIDRIFKMIAISRKP